MKESKKKFFEGWREERKDQSIAARWANRLGHIRRKMSRGASDIFRAMRTRSGFGGKVDKNNFNTEKK
jgi:hypothetical protein